MDPLVIWCNVPLATSPPIRQRLLDAVTGHTLHAVDGSTPADQSRSWLAQASVAFGHPPVDALLASDAIRWVEIASAGYEAYDRADLRDALGRRGAARDQCRRRLRRRLRAAHAGDDPGREPRAAGGPGPPSTRGGGRSRTCGLTCGGSRGSASSSWDGGRSPGASSSCCAVRCGRDGGAPAAAGRRSECASSAPMVATRRGARPRRSPRGSAARRGRHQAVRQRRAAGAAATGRAVLQRRPWIDRGPGGAHRRAWNVDISPARGWT